jgi:hypothetical protein
MNSSLVELLYAAYNSEFGIKVTTSDPDRLRQRMYKERKIDPCLSCLSFVTSPSNPAGEIWIVKKSNGPDLNQETHTEPA